MFAFPFGLLKTSGVTLGTPTSLGVVSTSTAGTSYATTHSTPTSGAGFIIFVGTGTNTVSKTHDTVTAFGLSATKLTGGSLEFTSSDDGNLRRVSVWFAQGTTSGTTVTATYSGNCTSRMTFVVQVTSATSAAVRTTENTGSPSTGATLVYGGSVGLVLGLAFTGDNAGSTGDADFTTMINATETTPDISMRVGYATGENTYSPTWASIEAAAELIEVS